MLQNSTVIFNIYGTTEVSSWSTCHALTQADLQRGEGEGGGERGCSRVPLGQAMLGTTVELRDTLGKGHGEIFLGGKILFVKFFYFVEIFCRWRVQGVSPRRRDKPRPLCNEVYRGQGVGERRGRGLF